jgi:hypothetical protein
MSPVSETQDTDWIDVEEDVLDGTADGEMSIWGSDRPYVAKDSTALWGEVERVFSRHFIRRDRASLRAPTAV